MLPAFDLWMALIWAHVIIGPIDGPAGNVLEWAYGRYLHKTTLDAC